jgi:hypothetical protein
MPLQALHLLRILVAPHATLLLLLLLLLLFQKHNPRCHTIIEAHPDVYAHMKELGWDKRPGVTILFGRWQDVLPQLKQYDGIFFDTYGRWPHLPAVWQRTWDCSA